MKERITTVAPASEAAERGIAPDANLDSIDNIFLALKQQLVALNNFVCLVGKPHLAHTIFLVMGHSYDLYEHELRLKGVLENALTALPHSGVVDVISVNNLSVSTDMIRLQELEHEAVKLRQKLGLPVKG